MFSNAFYIIDKFVDLVKTKLSFIRDWNREYCIKWTKLFIIQNATVSEMDEILLKIILFNKNKQKL